MDGLSYLTVKQLKEQLAALEKIYNLEDETKVFLDTGWDSVQELAQDALAVEKVQAFTVEDPLTKERFPGYSLLEKAPNMNADGEIETALIIRNLY